MADAEIASIVDEGKDYAHGATSAWSRERDSCRF